MRSLWLRPRTQAMFRRLFSSFPPVLSGKTRTTFPSLTCSRSAHLDWQLARQAFQTVRSTSTLPVPFGTSSSEGCEYGLGYFEQATKPVAAPAAADHFKKERRLGNLLLMVILAYELPITIFANSINWKRRFLLVKRLKNATSRNAKNICNNAGKY